MSPCDQPSQVSFPTGDYVRRLRRVADLSQRELAAVVDLSASSIRRLETGTMDPRLTPFARLLQLVGWRLAVVDEERREVTPLRELGGDLRDGAGRRYPAHLDVIVDPQMGEWWADCYGLAAPPETFARDREERDRRRARSQWHVGRGRRRRPDWL